MEISKKEKKYNLILGLVALLGVVVIVALIGLFALREETYVIAGEAEATEYRVSGKVPGRIESFLYEEGETVHKGDTVVIIDSPEIRAKLAQATGAKHAAEAQSQKAQVGARGESYDRVKRLFEKGVISAQKRDEVKAQYDAAAATARAAKTQYDMARNGAQEEDKMAAAALVERADGAIQEVSGYLSELYLTAPCDGEVSERFPKVGELVGSGSPIMSIVDLTDVWFTFAVSEDYLNGMAVGSSLNVRIPALGEQIYPVRVTHIKAMGSYATWRSTKENGGYDVRTFDVKCRPITAIPNLRPGMTALVVR